MNALKELIMTLFIRSFLNPQLIVLSICAPLQARMNLHYLLLIFVYFGMVAVFLYLHQINVFAPFKLSKYVVVNFFPYNSVALKVSLLKSRHPCHSLLGDFWNLKHYCW
jgi:hypothetical protein